MTIFSYQKHETHVCRGMGGDPGFLCQGLVKDGRNCFLHQFQQPRSYHAEVGCPEGRLASTNFP